MAKKEGQVIFKKDKYDEYRCNVSRKHAELGDTNRFAIMSMYIFTGIIVLTLFLILLGRLYEY